MPKVPEGYKDEAEFLAEARERFQQDIDFDRENTDEAREDLKFFAGEQWPDEDVKARDGRPTLTINQLPQFVAQIVGDIRINRPAIKVRPAEDADKDLATTREGLIRAIEHQSKAQNVYATAAQAQVACGIGNFRVVLDYATDDAFDMDILIKGIQSPFAVVWDAFRTEPTGQDAGHCFVAEDMPRKTFERLYPDVAPDDLGNDLNNDLQRGGWMTRDTVRVSEYWIMKERQVDIAMLQDGKIEEITPANAAQIEPLIAVNSRGEPLRRKATRKSACMYLITGHTILEDAVEHPISRIPVFRVPGWEVHTGEKTVRFGLVRFARDPQRLKNYWRSVAAETLALAPKQQWLVHESAEGDENQFSEAHASGSNVLIWSGQNEPRRIDPAPIPAALLQEAAMNAQDMKDVTGLHDASLGIKSNETSGKAILARQREGDVASYIYHDNLKSAIAECGRVVNEYIPHVYDTARTIRVLGEDETQTVQRVNDPMDPESVDLSKGKYDIVVETGPSYSTKRVEASESMMAFAQAVPQTAAVAGDLIAMAQDWPLAEKIGERIRRALPPQLTKEEGEQPAPPDPAQQQQMQAQQQQQAMAMQAAQIDLQTKAAGARKAEADAVRAEAEATKAQVEARQPPPAPKPAPPFNPRRELADTLKAEASAQREQIAAESDALDLHMKPYEAAHTRADLAIKLRPPEPNEPDEDD
jgi:hypothetical protein